MYLSQSYFNEHPEVLKEIDHLSLLLQNSIHSSKLLEFSWILYSLNQQKLKTTYIFREKNNELLVVRDGHVQKGSWELLTLSNSILINDGIGEMLYNIDFFCNEGIILRKENMQEFLILIKRNKNQLQLKGLMTIFSSFFASYEKNQRRFDNINLDQNNALLEYEDITEFREYGLFPYVTVLGTILLIIAILIFAILRFWPN